jgi:hypothetical protein
MEYRVRLNVLSAAVVIALGVTTSLITSTVVASRAYQSRGKQAALSAQDLTVKGSARTRVQSDLGVWHIGVTGEAADLQAAYSILEAAVERVRTFLAAQGFQPAEIALDAIDTHTHYLREKDGRETRQITGYTLARDFTVTSANVSQLTTAAGEVTQLLKENVRVASAPPQFYYSRIADMKVQILGEASRDALGRAQEIARNSGCSVGEVRKAHMGVIQITRPNSTEVSGYGIYDTATIEKDISVVVTVTYGVVNEG